MMKTQVIISTGMVIMMMTASLSCFGQKEVVVQGKSTGIGEAKTVQGVQTLPQGQETVRLEKQTSLDFKDESKKAELKIKFTDEYNILSVRMSCQLSSGSLVVYLIDPKGEEQGTFTVKAGDDVVMGEHTKILQQVMGQMQKQIINPLKGDWIVRAVPSNASCKLDIHSTLIKEPKVEYVGLTKVTEKESDR